MYFNKSNAVIKFSPAMNLNLNLKFKIKGNQNVPIDYFNKYSEIPKQILDEIVCHERLFIKWLNSDESNMKNFISDPIDALVNSNILQNQKHISKLISIRNQYKNVEDIPTGIKLDSIKFEQKINLKNK